MTSPAVLCIGEVLFDYLAEQLGRSFAEVESWTPYPGGAPANVACALTRLGTPAAFIGCVGQDANGDELLALMESLEVNLAGVQRHPQAPTRIVYVTRTLEGDRQFAGFGDYETTAFADTYLNAEGLPQSLFSNAKFLILGTLELAYPTSRAALDQAVQWAQHYGIQRFVDINWRPVFWPNLDEAPPRILELLSQADFIKASDEEAQWLLGSDDPQTIQHHYPQAKGVLITKGDRGCSYWLHGATGEVPAFQVPVVDTTGAGDAFVAGFIHQLCSQPHLDLSNPAIAQQVIRYASAVGALTVTQAGAIAAQPQPDDLVSFLADHG
ncbi:MAG TPA: carbohydrate kinase [Stenomitos sp.]